MHRSEVVVVVAAVAACLVAVITWRVLRGRGRRGTMVPGPERMVRLVVLGHKGAGKTVLLASMWRVLWIQGSRRIRMVVQRPDDEQDLQRLCNEIEAPGEKFPANTLLGETKEWQFRLQATNVTGSPVDVFRFSYLDYPGELLDAMDGDQELHQNFVQALRDADITVGMLDGQKIALLMDGKGDDGFAVSLSNLSLLLTRPNVKTKTLHIIITKWDLLKGRYTLEQVKERLTEFNGPFQDLMLTPRSGGVRLIPVSALGCNGFVYQHKATGHMRKSLTKGWRPEHVVAPLGATIPDVLETDARELRHRGIRRRRSRVNPADVSGLFVWVTLMLGFAVPIGGMPAFLKALQELAMRVATDRLTDSFAKVVTRSARRKTPVLLDDESGLLHALSFLREEVEHLEREVPAAKRFLPGVA